MLVKDIIKISAEFLELKDVVNCIENNNEISEDINDEINLFLLAINMVNSNIASSYIELVNFKEVTPNNENKIYYNSIDEKGVVEIKNVKSKAGVKQEFKCLPNCVILENNNECVIEYSYFPSKVDLDDNIDYFLKLNSYIFAMGVSAEYLYIKGNIDDAYMWDKKFKNSMFNLLRPKRNIVLPERRW